MSAFTNNWRGKREIQSDSHNRKPGRAKFFKHKKNRFQRRMGNKKNVQLVESINKNQEYEFEIRETTSHKLHSPSYPVIHKLIDFLRPEDVSKLRKLINDSQ